MIQFTYIRILIILNVSLLFIACGDRNANKEDNLDHPVNAENRTDYTERFRPQFHFTPKEKWMNDPNGLVYHQGVYHLFYQYYPDDIVWGPMHWGHAISKDMISWEHKPIALYPDELGYIFSGSAVIDIHNTSGFGTKENPPMVAIYTYHSMEGETAGATNFQTQGIAYSLDNGETFSKYEGNPVIPNDTGIKDFRDPKVYWDEEAKHWILILVAGDHAKFYRSDNLKEWVHLSDFGKDKGAHGGVWECPDLFKLKVGETEEEKWVLLISINPGAPNGGSGTQYFVGDFDGKKFTAEHEDHKWLDWGTDNYAGVTYNNTPNNERIFIGWMSNWNYARNTPTERWRSAMTLPRELSLIKENGSYFLRSNVLQAFNKLVSNVSEQEIISLESPFELDYLNFNQSEVTFKTNPSKQLKLEFTNNKNEKLVFEIDPANKKMNLDRTASGLVGFEPSFAKAIHAMPYSVSDKEVDVRIIMDWSSVEIFVNDGKYVMTDQIFPTEFYDKLTVSSSDKVELNNFNLNNIKSIWKDE